MKFEITIGRLWCRHVRNFLKRCQFDGKKIEFYESSGWLKKTFIIKGDDKDVVNVKCSLDKWAEENNPLDKDRHTK